MYALFSCVSSSLSSVLHSQYHYHYCHYHYADHYHYHDYHQTTTTTTTITTATTLCFNGHFPGGLGLASTRMLHSRLGSVAHSSSIEPLGIGVFTGRMSFLSPNQHCWLGDRKDIRPVQHCKSTGTHTHHAAKFYPLHCSIFIIRNKKIYIYTYNYCNLIKKTCKEVIL